MTSELDSVIDPLSMLLETVTGSQILDLSHDLVVDMPVSPAHPAYQFTLARRHGDRPRDDGISTANELLVLAAHTGTHVDAVGHASRNGKLAGGVDAAWAQAGGQGLRVHGAEELPHVVCRGVLLDVAALRGVACLDPGYEVTVADLEKAQARAGVAVRPGDAILVRTGWTSRWDDAARYLSSTEGTPGPGTDAADWLVERGARITGSDTLVYEVVRPGANVRPVHGRLLVDAAVPIIEALNLETLSLQPRAEFLFVMAPLKLVGATGSPVRPLAICFPNLPVSAPEVS